jgi:methionyl-tRNA formyltransferase
MRVVFMGTPAYAVPTLAALLGSRHQLVAVVAQPDRPAGRGRRMVSPPTVTLAQEHGVRTMQPRGVRSGPFPPNFVALEADVAVVVAYGRILTPTLLGAPRLGCVNAHGSLLPKYRGAAPIQWAIARGERETGVTTMLMDQGLDTGDMLLERAIPIGPDETAAQLAVRLADLSAQLVLETLDRLADITPRPQDHSQHSMAPILCKDHGHIDWSWPAMRIHDLVRGMNPWPMGQAAFRDQPIRVHQTRLVPDLDVSQVAPGTVVEARKRLVVATGDGALEIVQAQPANRRCLIAAALICGQRIVAGEVFA